MTFEKLLDASGLSQPQIAERAGVDQKTISNMKLGKQKDHRYGTLSAVAEVLGVSIPQLVKAIERTKKVRRAAA